MSTHKSYHSQEKLLYEASATNIMKDALSRTKSDRPAFNHLMSILSKSDTLIVTKHDRFARNAEDAIHTIKEIVGRGITVNILNMGIADNTPMGKLMITILSDFAEFERYMIVERTAEGKAIAKQKPDFR